MFEKKCVCGQPRWLDTLSVVPNPSRMGLSLSVRKSSMARRPAKTHVRMTYRAKARGPSLGTRRVGDSAHSLCASSASRKPDLDHTTVMIRHIACKYKEPDVRRILDEQGMAGTYSSVHVPESFSNRSNRGYVFVTFDSVAHVEMCKERLSGRTFGCSSTQKLCQVSMAHIQGRTSPIMEGRKTRGLRQSDC